MEKRTIWLRLGVTVELDNKYDEEALFSGGDRMPGLVLNRLIREGKYTIDGETYIPACMVTEFNQEYGTAYDGSEDIVYDW